MSGPGNCGSSWRSFGRALTRRKTYDRSEMNQTRLARCLSLLDLTAIGIGCTLGAGIYVVAGTVAHQTAGPSVIVSFAVAGIASVMAGLCYAEFGARVPKTGSAYVYSYVAVGEFTAFVIGWNMMLEYVIGTASVASALSLYIDSLTGGQIVSFYKAHTTIVFSTDFQVTVDILAFGFIALLSAVLCIGVRESSLFNNFFTGVNLFVVAYVTICGFFKYNFANWSIPASDVPPVVSGTKCDTVYADSATEPCYGYGGFFPFGTSGMLSGAATCFYAFVGFDVIATAGEEVHNPQRNIPLSIVLTLFACSLAYFSVSATMTLICPYYELNAQTPLSYAFTYVGWPVATYIIAVGAICALSASMLTGLLPLPRVIFAMAEDGVIFRWLSAVHPRTQTPVIATAISGFLAAFMAAVFNLEQLVDMMSIGTLMAYAIVALSVTLLRYRPPLFASHQSTFEYERLPEGSNAHAPQLNTVERTIGTSSDATSERLLPRSGITTYDAVSVHRNADASVNDTSDSETNETVADLFCWSSWRLLLIERSVPEPNATSTRYTSWLISLYCLLTVVLCLLLVTLNLTSAGAIAACGGVGFCCLLVTIAIRRMPESKEKVSFKVPFVPFLPCLSILTNLYLMSKLGSATWIRFAVWMAIGLSIYFGYGIFHSSERSKTRRVKEHENASAAPSNS